MPPPESAPPDQPPVTFDQAVGRLAEQYRLLVEPGQVIELRALGVQRGRERPHTEAGFFDTEHLRDLAAAALRVTEHARGVYFTLNPLKPDLLARRRNRIDWAGAGELTADADVLARRWLLIDADPVRDPHVSATDAEKLLALQTVHAVHAHLSAREWPDPLLADSGNGYHLLYRIDLPADDNGLVARVLRALAARFNTDRVTIDQRVANPARICKLPGTLARKGDHTPQRPHRRARVLEVPSR